MRRMWIVAAVTMGIGMVPGASAARAASAPRTKHFTTIAVGATISNNHNRFEDAYRIKQSPDGGGAGFQDGQVVGTRFPATVHDIFKAFYRNGLQIYSETLTEVPPHTNSVGSITGNGSCAGGTGVHAAERCSYSVTGTYDLISGVTELRRSGTFTR